MVVELAAVRQRETRRAIAFNSGKIIQRDAIERGRRQRDAANRAGYGAVIGENPVLRVIAIDAIARRCIDHRARRCIEGGRAWTQRLQSDGGCKCSRKFDLKL